MTNMEDIGKLFLEHTPLDTTVYDWSPVLQKILEEASLISPNNMLAVVCEGIVSAQDKIYATHNLESEDDLVLPEIYLHSLKQSKSSQRIRLVFGNKKLFKTFQQSEIWGFENIFIDWSYQRMVLIDNKVFYKIGNKFYWSSNKNIVDLLLEYFNSAKQSTV